MIKKLIFKNLLILACLGIFSQKTHAMQYVNDYPKAFQTAASLAAGVGVFALSTLIHECGHAFMAKILLNSPLDINIGGYDKPKMKIGFFSLNGFNPFTGYANTDLSRSKKTDRVVINLAGPISGAVASLCFSKLSDNQLYKAICCASSIRHILNLYPQFAGSYNSEQLKSDGALILEEYADEKFADKITSLLSNIVIKKVVFGILTFVIIQKMEALNLCSINQALNGFEK